MKTDNALDEALRGATDEATERHFANAPEELRQMRDQLRNLLNDKGVSSDQRRRAQKMLAEVETLINDEIEGMAA